MFWFLWLVAALRGVCFVEWILFDGPCSGDGEDSTTLKYLLLECRLNFLYDLLSFEVVGSQVKA